MLFSVYNAVLTSYLAVDTLNFPYQTGKKIEGARKQQENIFVCKQ